MRTTAIHRAALPTAAAALLLLLAACKGSDGPTQVRGTLLLSAASVSVDGQPYDGGTYHLGRGPGTSTMFAAHLGYHDGAPAPGERVWVEYHHGGGMMGSGRFGLYDDGTHGDPVAGDGIYCFEDHDGSYGFHHRHAARGEYRYDFWGVHHDGGSSNRHRITVRVAD